MVSKKVFNLSRSASKIILARIPNYSVPRCFPSKNTGCTIRYCIPI